MMGVLELRRGNRVGTVGFATFVVTLWLIIINSWSCMFHQYPTNTTPGLRLQHQVRGSHFWMLGQNQNVASHDDGQPIYLGLTRRVVNAFTRASVGVGAVVAPPSTRRE
jgi:hypothetical protein